MKIWIEYDTDFKEILFVRDNRPNKGMTTEQFVTGEDMVCRALRDTEIMNYILSTLTPIEVTARSKLYGLDI